jgi:hypothetical protein
MVAAWIKGPIPSGFGVALTSRVNDMETKDNVKVGDELFTHLNTFSKLGMEFNLGV